MAVRGMIDDTDRPYKTLVEALAMADRHRALGISVSTEAIRETLTKVAQLERALVGQRAERNYYRTLGGQAGSWDNEWTGFQDLFQRAARAELEESGILKKLQNGAK